MFPRQRNIEMIYIRAVAESPDILLIENHREVKLVEAIFFYLGTLISIFTSARRTSWKNMIYSKYTGESTIVA